MDQPADNRITHTGRHEDARVRIALVWRGDPSGPSPDPKTSRMRPIFASLADLHIAAEPVLYADHAVEMVRERLLGFDGVLAWVDPISDGEDRSRFDPMLRDLAKRGIWVSAHPDIILKMGVKQVLHRTRELGWGVDTHLYETVDAFRNEFPTRLASAGPRVLKQNRGNGGIGVWKVELAAPGSANRDALVDVLDARSDQVERGVRLADFMDRCETYLAGPGRLIDQPHQPRVGDGMVRCYLAQNQVIGFSEQSPRSIGLKPTDPGVATFGMASGKIMHDETMAAFQGLRQAMEADWVPGLQRLLDIETAALPALWDADFLYGPKTAAGQDSYVLCEINCSSVAPFPETAGDKIARVAAAGALAAKERRN